MKNKYVYSFAEGDGRNKKLLGGKGANLCEMTQIGINVPPGFVISTEACLEYLDKDELPADLLKEVKEQIQQLEQTTGKTFGSGPDPLLVSVRSGSALSRTPVPGATHRPVRGRVPAACAFLPCRAPAHAPTE